MDRWPFLFAHATLTIKHTWKHKNRKKKTLLQINFYFNCFNSKAIFLLMDLNWFRYHRLKFNWIDRNEVCDMQRCFLMDWYLGKLYCYNLHFFFFFRSYFPSNQETGCVAFVSITKFGNSSLRLGGF